MNDPLTFQVVAGDYGLSGNQPANYTLVQGEREALLVDVPFARSDAHRLIAAILDSGRALKTIFISHDHPDHFFSLDLLSDTFPEAVVVAHPVVVADMGRSIPLKFERWAEGMGANAPRRGVVPTPWEKGEIEVEGRTLKILGPMQGDHVHATALWDPGTRTLVAGDLLFNGVFLFLGEHRPPQYDDWLKSLDDLESLQPARIIAGHSKPGLPDDSLAIDWSRRYLTEFKRAAKAATSSGEMADMLRAAFPDAVGFPGTQFLLDVPTQVATGEMEPWDE
ncbi:MBL fold metallo-hydrolase [Streptacidiphilus cavernicola]|uniref:MBL fold metallo-hydrolase n=1 Tax=Streptacidiphilus cavernicola TaxID=3342716 RepID=A0ABV6W555_9ACTN